LCIKKVVSGTRVHRCDQLAIRRKLTILLQLLAKRIIVDSHSEIIEQELNSPFVYLRSLVQGLITPGNGKGGSEHVPLGASISQKPPTDKVERFLFMLRFDSKGKVNALGSYVDTEAS
jgi:hypothetical protein